jgi:hypothetical protein
MAFNVSGTAEGNCPAADYHVQFPNRQAGFLSGRQQGSSELTFLLCLILDGGFFLGAFCFPSFHSAIMRVRLFVVLAAKETEEEKNVLRVARPHAASLQCWWAVVKRSAMSHGELRAA